MATTKGVRTHVDDERDLGHLASCFEQEKDTGFFFVSSSSTSPPLHRDVKASLSSKCQNLWNACTFHESDGDDEMQFHTIPQLFALLDEAMRDLRRYQGGVAYAQSERKSGHDAHRIANAMNALIFFKPWFDSLVYIGSSQHSSMQKLYFEKNPENQAKLDQKGKAKLYSAFFLPPIEGCLQRSELDSQNSKKWLTGLVKGQRKDIFKRMTELISFTNELLNIDLHFFEKKVPKTTMAMRKTEIDILIESIVEEHRITVEENQRIQRLHRRLCNMFNMKWKIKNSLLAYKLTLYGSLYTQLGVRGSDCDFSLDVICADSGEVVPLNTLLYDVKYCSFKHEDENQRRREIKTHIYRAADNLRRSGGFRDIQPVVNARVPVISAYDSDTSVAFDICLDNSRAVKNSTLLREYANLDYRVRDLILMVKVWTKANRIGCARYSGLSSYSWSILVIFFLQRTDFIPNLQCPLFIKRHRSKNKSSSSNFPQNFLSASEVLSAGIWQSPNSNITLSTLLFGFFSFYHIQYNSNLFTVSIRLGREGDLIKGCFCDSSRIDRMSIEDPFETCSTDMKHDLGTPMGDTGQIKISKTLKVAFEELSRVFYENRDLEECVRKILTPNDSENGKGKKSSTKKSKNKKSKHKKSKQVESTSTKMSQYKVVVHSEIPQKSPSAKKSTKRMIKK